MELNYYPRIRELREDKDMSQKEMADILHVSQATYSRYERGELDIPTQTLIHLAVFMASARITCLGWTKRKRGRAGRFGKKAWHFQRVLRSF